MSTSCTPTTLYPAPWGCRAGIASAPHLQLLGRLVAGHQLSSVATSAGWQHAPREFLETHTTCFHFQNTYR